jgi:hypothetical protein
MRSTLRTSLIATSLTVLCGATAHAQFRTYYHVGNWDAFSGQGTDGKWVCGVGTTNPTDNRSFSIRFIIDGDSVLFEAKKPTWSIPANTQLPVVMQVGLNTPWNMQAGGDGQTIQWTMDRGTMQTFDQQFRAASSMTLSFPTGNEPPWTVSLGGSTAISNAFGRCVTDLTTRYGAAPSAPAPAPSAPTQPFGQSSTQPGAPAPAPDGTQPTQPTQPGAPPPR